MSELKVFKLYPIAEHAEAPEWHASLYKGEVLVAAPNEGAARMCVTQKVWIATPFKQGEEVLYNPWNSARLVKCEEISDYTDLPDGPGIIEPSELINY